MRLFTSSIVCDPQQNWNVGNSWDAPNLRGIPFSAKGHHKRAQWCWSKGECFYCDEEIYIPSAVDVVSNSCSHWIQSVRTKQLYRMPSVEWTTRKSPTQFQIRKNGQNSIKLNSSPQSIRQYQLCWKWRRIEIAKNQTQNSMWKTKLKMNHKI